MIYREDFKRKNSNLGWVDFIIAAILIYWVYDGISTGSLYMPARRGPSYLFIGVPAYVMECSIVCGIIYFIVSGIKQYDDNYKREMIYHSITQMAKIIGIVLLPLSVISLFLFPKSGFCVHC